MKGLDVFREHFRSFDDQYVLIGGSAAMLEMAQVGESFRATHDLDLVLLIEARTEGFGAALMEFVERAGYKRREVGGRPQFYRFSDPCAGDAPAMLEIFSRAPDGLVLHHGQRAIPVTLGGDLKSLSGLLLDDAYYNVIRDAARTKEGLSWLDARGLIVLKAKAWLDLRERRAADASSVDSKRVRKHLFDVLALSQVIPANASIDLPESILKDVRRFLQAALIEPPTRDFGEPLEVMLARIGRLCGLQVALA
ncbi:hypothetical protein [Dyella sp. 333MFSha]|uniref:hypothetical protein n=1 Tax=Dyella sp. 333MFSha TaxID=1798240 RepID=UPI00088FAFE9|nr:hypothetical protein [Dyella sp. 333MFSha]SDG49929.1 Nucleotidyl transferase AbiEii toxin, Type IV TA system [Dyella sp. 333MFSha]